MKNFRQVKDLNSTERKYNDKAGIIFLFSLIGVVFFMDIYIELSRIDLRSDSGSKIESTFFPSDYFSDLLSGSETQKSDQNIYFSPAFYDSNETAHSSIKLSLLFYLLASFTFSCFKIIKNSETKTKVLSHYVSFVNTGQIGYTSPRSPPEFI